MRGLDHSLRWPYFVWYANAQDQSHLFARSGDRSAPRKAGADLGYVQVGSTSPGYPGRRCTGRWTPDRGGSAAQAGGSPRATEVHEPHKRGRGGVGSPGEGRASRVAQPSSSLRCAGNSARHQLSDPCCRAGYVGVQESGSLAGRAMADPGVGCRLGGIPVWTGFRRGRPRRRVAHRRAHCVRRTGCDHRRRIVQCRRPASQFDRGLYDRSSCIARGRDTRHEQPSGLRALRAVRPEPRGPIEGADLSTEFTLSLVEGLGMSTR